MFREALDYPTRAPRGGRAVLVGGTLLVLVGALTGVAALETSLAPLALAALLPWLLVRGYYVRVVRSTVGRESPTPPSFGGVGALLADGVRAVLVALGYLLPAAVVLAPLAYARSVDVGIVTLLFGEGVSGAVADALLAGFGVLALFALLYLIGAVYALPAAVANFAYAGRLREAFDVRRIAGAVATEDYVVAWGVTVLLQLLVLPVAYALRVLLVGFYLHFLVAVGVRYCYGQGFGAALGLDPLESTLDEGEGAETGAAAGATPAVRPIEETDVPELRSPPSRRDGEAERGPDSEPRVGREREPESASDPESESDSERTDEDDEFIWGGDAEEQGT